MMNMFVFEQRPCPAKKTSSAGRVLGPEDLSEKSERALLRRNGGKGLLAPYGGYNPLAKPVVVVHGLRGNPSELKSIIDRFQKDERYQVYVFFYRDRQNSIDTSGDDLAREIDLLRTKYLNNDQLDVTIIAHSMGGIVSQAAINSMINPEWFPDHKKRRKLEQPVINKFAGVKLVTMDTPLTGGTMNQKRLGPANWSKFSRHRRAIMDMISRSRLMRSLYGVPRPDNVAQHQFEAKDPSLEGMFDYRGLHELDDARLKLLIQFILTDGEDVPEPGRVAKRLSDEKAGDRPLLNQLLALRQEQSYGQLKAALEAQPRPVPLDTARDLLDKYVPRVPGDHVSMLDDPEFLETLVEIASSPVGDEDTAPADR